MGDIYYKKAQIYEAVFYNDWGWASKAFEANHELRTQPMNKSLETPLMIVVGTNRSHYFVEKLLFSLHKNYELIKGAIDAVNKDGDTALHYAAKTGNMTDAKRMIDYLSFEDKAAMLQHRNKKDQMPLHYAAKFGRKKEMLELFYLLTGVFSRTPSGSNASFVVSSLLFNAIDAGFLDIASKILDSFASSPHQLQTTMHFLAKKTELFPSRRTVGPWCRRHYDLFDKEMTGQRILHDEVSDKETTGQRILHDEVSDKETTGQRILHDEVSDKETTGQRILHDEEAIYISEESSNNTYGTCTSTTPIFLIKRIFQYLVASPFKEMYGLNSTHNQAKQLVKRICRILRERRNPEAESLLLINGMQTAVEHGNYEVFKKCISACPSIIWTYDEGFKVKNFFHEAIKHRQEQIYNLVYQISSYKALVLSEVDDETGENILHIAAKLGPSHRLNIITGAALQMQRELQWFQEVESLVEPSLKEGLNNQQKTPETVFNEEHKELLKEGKEWMKDTASSSTVVATLIMTVAFAAIFTLPGGDANKGKTTLKFFIISDAIALFSSATSALLFLGILTSRYAPKDFLQVLPMRLMGGIFSLFVSLAATMITFSATLVLQPEVPWIGPPLVVMTGIPIGIFLWIKLPLLIKLFFSTFGNIFPKYQERVIR